MTDDTFRPVQDALIHELVTHHHLHLCRAIKLVGTVAAAEDVLQNTAVKCLTCPPAKIPDKPLRYVSRMVRNAAIDYLRKHQKEICCPFETEPQLARAGTTPLCGAVHLQRKQELSAVMLALSELPQRKRDVFLRHRLSDVAQKDIAEEMNVSRTLINFMVKNTQERCLLAMERDG